MTDSKQVAVYLPGTISGDERIGLAHMSNDGVLVIQLDQGDSRERLMAMFGDDWLVGLTVSYIAASNAAAQPDDPPRIPTGAFRVKYPAHQWLANGDHPDDHVGEEVEDFLTGGTYTRIEGAVVRFYRNPERSGTEYHELCDHIWDDHGFIDEPGQQDDPVCPGDWIVDGPNDSHFRVKRAIFEALFEPVTV